jgi:uncharacterized membrane protein YgcG
MKMFRKLALAAVAVATLSLATPAQAFWFPFFRPRVVVGYPGYYGYARPVYYGYYNPYYYGPGYYGGYYGPGVTFAFGGRDFFRGGRGFRGGFGGGFRGGGGHGGHR